MNDLVTELLTEVEKMADILKDNPHAEIDSVLNIVNQITSVQQLGFYKGNKPLSNYYNMNSNVKYLPVKEEPGLWTCGCFAIPAFGKIPLHDHPEMIGVIRVLEGSVEIDSFDTCHNDSYHTHYRGSTKFDAPSTVCLGSTMSNIHRIKAGASGALFLDILMPDYDDDNGRKCNFYQIVDETEITTQIAVASNDQIGNDRSKHCENGKAKQQIGSRIADNEGADLGGDEGILVQLELIENEDVNIFTTQWPDESIEFESIPTQIEEIDLLNSLGVLDLSNIVEPPILPDETF